MRKYQKRKRGKSTKWILVLLIAFCVIWKLLIPYVRYTQRQDMPIPYLINSNSISLSAEEINSRNAVLIQYGNEEILLEKNADEFIYPASMTKIMTVIVALEELPITDKRFMVSQESYDKMQQAGASMAGFRVGEWVKGIDLMYGALISSGGECCLTLAEGISGSEEEFVKLMNKKALEIGMMNTNFVNCTGLHDEQHYSTAKDIALLLAYALQDSSFRDIFTSHSHHTSLLDNKQPGGVTLTSTLFNYKYDTSLANGKILGGKTGYTDHAGYCLASLAEISGKEYILVTAQAWNDGEHVKDAVNIYNRL